MSTRSVSAGALITFVITTTVALVFSVLSVTPAAAEGWTHDDPSGDGRAGPYGDIIRVRAAFNEHRLKIKVRVRGKHHQGYYTNVRVDTDKADRGPELIMIRNSDTARHRAFVHRATTWQSFPFGDRPLCRARARLKDSGKVLTWKVPRTCLRTDGELPRKLRLNVQTEEDAWYGDYAPGKKRWSSVIQMG
ncbi:hypothetical protein ASG90_04670 [Nocardioides sp. Soil797]|nr:hypothetical protein ASG90_04670 [Nocardioides sp. Soil797]